MTEFTNGHPEYGELLALVDHDLPRMSSAVRRHYRECPKCRRDMQECDAAVFEYQQFENTFVLPAIPPPNPWQDLRQSMRRLDEAKPSKRTLGRIAWRLAAPLANSAGRLVAGGTALGCLAFAIVLMTRSEKRSEQRPIEQPRMAAPSRVTPTLPAVESRKAANNGRPRGPVDAGLPAVESSVNTEVRVFAALHRLGADLGEPVEIRTGSDGRVAVGGTGVSPDRQAEIREALSAERAVAVRFTDSSAVASGPEERARFETGHSALEARIREFAGGQSAYESLTNRVLDESDAVVTRAHALAALAERFPDTRRAELREAERRTLETLTADHRAAFEQHARTLLLLVAPLAKALGAPVPDSVPAQGVLLQDAQRMDRVLSAVFGAPTTMTSDELLTELAGASAALATDLGR